MKVAISTLSNSDFESVRSITGPILADYCDAHGYAYHPIVTDSPERSIIWDRYRILRELLDAGFDRVAHFDCDVLVTNRAVRLEYFPGGGDMVIAKNLCEDGKRRFNDGVVIFDQGSQPLLARIFTYQPEAGEPIYCGQDVIQKLYDVGQIQPAVVPQNQLNSFRYSEYGMTATEGDWRPGDFVLHLPGCANERRIEILTAAVGRL